MTEWHVKFEDVKSVVFFVDNVVIDKDGSAIFYQKEVFVGIAQNYLYVKKIDDID